MKQRITVFHYEGAERVWDGEGDSELTYPFEHEPTALVLVCQTCGWEWCRMVPHFDQSLDHQTTFQPLMHMCQRCGNGCLSNINLVYREFTIPDELLAREVELLAVCRDTLCGGSHYV